jgi:hypothetical protein
VRSSCFADPSHNVPPIDVSANIGKRPASRKSDSVEGIHRNGRRGARRRSTWFFLIGISWRTLDTCATRPGRAPARLTSVPARGAVDPQTGPRCEEPTAARTVSAVRSSAVALGHVSKRTTHCRGAQGTHRRECHRARDSRRGHSRHTCHSRRRSRRTDYSRGYNNSRSIVPRAPARLQPGRGVSCGNPSIWVCSALRDVRHERANRAGREAWDMRFEFH